jgi:hypothetical protein
MKTVLWQLVEKEELKSVLISQESLFEERPLSPDVYQSFIRKLLFEERP